MRVVGRDKRRKADRIGGQKNSTWVETYLLQVPFFIL